MSDIEDTDFYVESWSFLGKKDSKKKAQKLKNIVPQMTQPSTQKVKKKSKFKEAMLENKERIKEKRKEKNKDKKKVKKKKKKKSNLELDNLMVMQSNSAQAKPFQMLALKNQNLNEKLKPDHLPQDSVKEAKRKKHVAFGSLPSYIRVKRPHFASLSPKEAGIVSEGESYSQVILAGQTQNQPLDDFQCASDDLNSQDLFITQKTFRVSPSSSEISDRVASPRSFEKQDGRREMNWCQTKTDKCPQDAHQHVQEPKLKINTEKGEGVYELHEWEKMPFQTQMKFKVNLSQQEKKSADIEPKMINLYMDKPFVINPTPDASCLQHVSETPLLLPRTANGSTQTENFFSAELSSYLDFCQNRRAAVHAEDLKPLDLSLPHRARKDLCLSAKMSAADVKADTNKMLLQGGINSDGGEGVSASPQVKHMKMTELSRHVETTPSPQSETDTKSTDMTASSEDDNFCRSGKRDLLQFQVGAVQLRLNKPFFFKTKGEGLSPRPESPLMKLSQGRDAKCKRRR